ncbi:MAG: hypothetical protein JW874_07565 [Spirochaetales bacterium]|nr:hypothetical protein [Spirochaetales bacterium]
MKLTKKNSGHFIALLLLGLIVGTLCWELFARIISSFGTDISFAVGPIGFDVLVLQFYIKLNPGSVAGIIGGALLFRKMK